MEESEARKDADFGSVCAELAFNGSLTTPPCSEKVQWVVLKNPISASKKQIESLHTILHDNARDVQPINDRDIESAN